MNVPPPAQLTQLLEQWQQGDREALETLMPVVYCELKRLAGSTASPLCLLEAVPV